MLKILNRFAWIIAILLGIQIAGLFGLYYLGYTGNVILGIIIGIILKKVLLSENFIKENIGNLENINPPTVPFHEEDKDNFVREKIEENIINLSEIEEEKVVENEYLNSEKENRNENIYSLQEEKAEKITDLKNSENYTQEKYENNAFDDFIEKMGTYIKDFFSTNLLAKLGGILVFFAVLFLLKGVFLDMGAFSKIILGIVVGFVTYFIGVKIHSKYENEGLILMGIGILINFAVILSGRYLLGENGYLSEGTTFIFLILNTVFAVLTSLVYKSKTLLLFSFIFAYLNPILTGGSSDTPYTLIGYSLIVSLGALYLSIREANLTLLIISFIAGNLLFLAAPFSDSIGWSAKIIFTSILSIITIFSIGKFRGLKPSVDKLIVKTFIGTYVFIILNLLNSTTSHSGMIQVMGSALESNLGFIVYNIIILGLFAFTIKIIKANSQQSNINPLSILLFIPLIILIGILFSGNLIFSSFVLIGTIITYLIGFVFLATLSNIFSYIFFGIIGAFIFLFNISSQVFGINIEITNLEFIISIITSLIFLFSTYYYSREKGLSALFSIGTIGTILILSPIISNSGEFMNLSVIAIIIFIIANLVLPFINKYLFEKENINNLVIGSLAGALFFAFQIYSFGELYFPGVTEGFAFLALAIIYFLQGYFVANKIGFEKMKSDSDLKNIFYTFIAISISLFSIAIAFVFSDSAEIITTVWLFEATILYFFYSKDSNQKIFWAATILFIIGLSKFGILINEVESKQYLFLISFGVILASFILNLFFINKVEIKNNPSQPSFNNRGRSYHNLHHILHIIGMGIMGLLLLKIIPSSGHGWSLFGISIFITLLGVFYAKFNFKFLKIVFLVLITLFGVLHIGEISSVFYKLQRDDLEYLKILQYIVTTVIVSNIFIWKKLNNSIPLNKILLIIISIYSFIISNLFIIDLFENIFGDYTLTIYWGLIASALLIYGIQKDIIKYRTIGLYFLTLTSAKIFLYDVWEISDTNSRVAVFAVLGVIFIIISTLYTKRFGDNLLGEFSLDNLRDKTPPQPSNFKEKKSINEEIKNIDISDIKSVRFKFKNGKSINIRAGNLVKITKLVINQLNGQTKFEAGDLTDIFKFIKSNYKTELSKDNFEKIIDILKKFVKEGGEVELVKKI